MTSIPNGRRILSSALGLTLLLGASGTAAAQSTAARSGSASATMEDSRRFLQIFIEDAAVVENGWIEGQVRYQDLSNDSDLLGIGPILAFSPVDGLEVGGRLSLLDVDFPGNNSESGLGDTTVYGKWQFFRNPVQFAVGAELFLPTGDEEKFLGTGEFDAAVFASVRKNLAEAYVTGHFGFRKNNDARVGGDLGPVIDLDGKTSIFLGGGVMFPLSDRFALSGELTVETERYEDSDSAVALTAGAYWFAGRGFSLRGGIGLGLDDGAPDVEVIFGAAWTF